MSNQIQIKRSVVPGKVPTIEQLDFGELAVNITDGKLYMKFDHGTGPVIEEVGVGTLLPLVVTLQSDLQQLRTDFDAYITAHP